MSVKDLPALGKFLLGEGADDTPGWLQVWLSTKSFTESKNLNFQAVHSSTSPLGDFLALGLEQRLVLLGARYSSGRRQLVPVFQALSNKFQIDVYFFEVYTHCEAPKLISNKIEIHPF